MGLEDLGPIKDLALAAKAKLAADPTGGADISDRVALRVDDVARSYLTGLTDLGIGAASLVQRATPLRFIAGDDWARKAHALKDEYLTRGMSADSREAQMEFDAAKGFWASTGAAITNPR